MPKNHQKRCPTEKQQKDKKQDNHDEWKALMVNGQSKVQGQGQPGTRERK